MPPKDDDPDLTRAVAKRIAALRQKRGLTQIEMAERLGITQAGYSKYERGAVRLTTSAIVKLARTLSVTADEILGLKKSR